LKYAVPIPSPFLPKNYPKIKLFSDIPVHFPFPISSQTPTQELLPRLRCIWIFEFHEAITLKQNLVIYSGQGKEESESCKYLLCFVSACSSTFSLLSCTQIGFFPLPQKSATGAGE
jgi:hypothetical protein